MIPPSGDRSDRLFKKLLVASLLVYFIFAILIEFIPYTPELIKKAVKTQRVVKLIQLPVKEPPPTEEQKRKEEEKKRLAEEERRRLEQKRLEEEKKRLAEERRLREEQERLRAEKRKIEEEKRREEEKRLAEERKKIEEEQNRLKEQKQLEDKKRLEEEKRIAEERRLIEEQKRLEEERRIAEEKRRIEEQKRIEEEKRLAEEKQRLEEQRRLEEERRIAEEKRRIEEQKRIEEEKRIAEEKRLIEEQRRLEEERRIAEEKRRIEEQKRIEEEKRLAKERNRQIAMSSGLLKTMKGGKTMADAIVDKEEIKDIVSTPSDKLIQAQQEISSPPSIPKEMKEPKGSEGIGEIPRDIAEAQISGLSGKKDLSGIEISYTYDSSISGERSSAIQKERSQGSIKDVVTKHRGALDFIYKKALRNNPTLKGVMVVEFTIAENGDVTAARILSTTLKNPSFEDQVLKRIQSWKFTPAPNTGNTIVSYPIEFSPA